MKLISEHLGEIIVALAGVALLISAITLFDAELSTFFTSIITKLTSLGDTLVNGLEVEVPAVQ